MNFISFTSFVLVLVVLANRAQAGVIGCGKHEQIKKETYKQFKIEMDEYNVEFNKAAASKTGNVNPFIKRISDLYIKYTPFFEMERACNPSTPTFAQIDESFRMAKNIYNEFESIVVSLLSMNKQASTNDISIDNEINSIIKKIHDGIYDQIGSVIDKISDILAEIINDISPTETANNSEVVDNKVVDNKVVDNKVVDNKVVDNKVVDNKVVDDSIECEDCIEINPEDLRVGKLSVYDIENDDDSLNKKQNEKLIKNYNSFYRWMVKARIEDARKYNLNKNKNQKKEV